MKLGQNFCLDEISDEYENGSCQVKETRSQGQILEILFMLWILFCKPRVMGAIESLGCNWWNNMHQIDA